MEFSFFKIMEIWLYILILILFIVIIDIIAWQFSPSGAKMVTKKWQFLKVLFSVFYVAVIIQFFNNNIISWS